MERTVFRRIFVEGVLCFLDGFGFELFLDLLSEVLVLRMCCSLQKLLCFRVVFESCLSGYPEKLIDGDHLLEKRVAERVLTGFSCVIGWL